MCSIQEAWGDFDNQQNNLNNNNHNNSDDAKLKFAKQNMMDLDSQRQVLDSNRQQIDADLLNNKYVMPDVVGQPVTQSDNRRQYAQTSADIFNYNFEDKLMSKPLPEKNSFTRGVHNKYSREKRIDHRNHPNMLPLKNVQTNSDPNYFKKHTDKKPAYLDLYDNPYNVTPNIGPIGKSIEPAVPLASNDDNDTDSFMDITTDYFNNTGQPNNASRNNNSNSFTPEKIINPDVLNKIQNHSVNQNNESHYNSNHGSFNNSMNNGANNANNNGANNGSNNASNNSSNKNSSNNEAKKIKELQQQISFLMDKLENLETKVANVENNKCHDIILIIVIAIFILFIIDNLFKLGRFS